MTQIKGKRWLIPLGLLICAVGAVKLAAELRQRFLPRYTQAAFIEARYSQQIETLRRLARSGQPPEEADRRQFESPEILGAFVSNGHVISKVKRASRMPEGGTWLPTKPSLDQPAITIWSDGLIQYEMQVEAPGTATDGEIRRFLLILDGDALKKLAATGQARE